MSIPSKVPHSVQTGQALDVFVEASTWIVRRPHPVTGQYENLDIVWKDNLPFKAAMVLNHITAAGGLAHVYLGTSDGKEKYRIRPQMFVKMLPRVNIISGVIVEMWMFERRGNNVYIIPEFLKEETDF